jgi:hypothetical protein
VSRELRTARGLYPRSPPSASLTWPALRPAGEKPADLVLPMVLFAGSGWRRGGTELSAACPPVVEHQRRDRGRLQTEKK